MIGGIYFPSQGESYRKFRSAPLSKVIVQNDKIHKERMSKIWYESCNALELTIKYSFQELFVRIVA